MLLSQDEGQCIPLNKRFCLSLFCPFLLEKTIDGLVHRSGEELVYCFSRIHHILHFPNNADRLPIHRDMGTRELFNVLPSFTFLSNHPAFQPLQVLLCLDKITNADCLTGII